MDSKVYSPLRPIGPQGSRRRDTPFPVSGLVTGLAVLMVMTCVPHAANAARLPASTHPVHYALTLRPDAQALRFQGEEAVDFVVDTPTDGIVLNAANLHIDAARLETDQRKSSGPVSVTSDDTTQTVRFGVTSQLATGHYRLIIRYGGEIGRSGNGLFALDYQGERAGGSQRALFTQLEAADARRLMPCWDEPAFKATFALSVVVPSGQMAVSNMPIESDRPAEGGEHEVAFATTPNMSTYLLFLAVGDFERASRSIAGTTVGVVTRRGALPQADFALASAAQILPWFNHYFGVRYPLPKLDNIAGPGQSLTYGAMENWGAIFSFEGDFLIDPKTASEHQKQGVFTVLAHEMAHQWFGDLVTMSWWNDLWLNEGFASWMQEEAARHFHPEWNTDLAVMTGRDMAMKDDARSTTHPVVQPVADGSLALQSFDFITYFKGEAAVRMIEAYVGPDAWRAGLSRYLAHKAYGNSGSQDLWAAVSATSGRPIAEIAHDITELPGVPLVHVTSSCSGGNSLVQLEQGEFHADRTARPEASWHLPVVLGHPGQPGTQVLLWRTASITLEGCGPVVVNLGQKGYYRTLYSPDAFTAVASAFPRLSAIDQIGLLSDTAALGLAGGEPADDLLGLLDRLGPASDPAVIADAIGRWNLLYGNAAAEPTEQAELLALATARFEPILAKLGWDARDNESSAEASLRASLIEILGDAGEPTVLGEARRRFHARDADPQALPAPLKLAILKVVSRQASTRDWEDLLGMARKETSPQLREALFGFLGRPLDPRLADRALELALTDEPAPTTAPRMIETVALLHAARAAEFAAAHDAQLMPRLDSFAAATFVPDLASYGADAATLDFIERYRASNGSPAVAKSCADAAASVSERISVRQDRMPAVFRWLDVHYPAPPLSHGAG